MPLRATNFIVRSFYSIARATNFVVYPPFATLHETNLHRVSTFCDIVRDEIGHFQASQALIFKTRLSVKPLL